jgi:hypothetical protein
MSGIGGRDGKASAVADKANSHVITLKLCFTFISQVHSVTSPPNITNKNLNWRQDAARTRKPEAGAATVAQPS